MKTVDEWTAHWDAKAEIQDPVALNGYCLGGVPISQEDYFAAVVNPVIERLDLKSHHRVLDIGCGSGLTLMEIEKQVADTVGTDSSSVMISRYKGKAKTYVCTALDLPFSGEEFDRILMFSVAIFFPSFDYFREVIEKAVSLLRPDGLILIGDLLVGEKPEKSQFQWYNKLLLVQYLDSLGFAYSLLAQNQFKRSINQRLDIIIYKD